MAKNNIECRAMITWLDLTNEDRKDVLEVLKRLQEPGTQDDLGARSLQIALSNLLFPGTSVLLTRLRYVFFIPWIHLWTQHELKKANNKDATLVYNKIREKEIWLKDMLLKQLTGEDRKKRDVGIIGSDSIKGELSSSVSATKNYLTTLKKWQIMQNFDSLNAYYIAIGNHVNTEGTSTDDNTDNTVDGWHSQIRTQLPKITENTIKEKLKTGFVLQQQEAKFLQDWIEQIFPGSLLGYFVRQDPVKMHAWLTQDTTKIKTRRDLWRFKKANLQDHNKLEPLLFYAECFADLLYGANLLYNCILCAARLTLARRTEQPVPLTNEEIFTLPQKQFGETLTKWQAKWKQRKQKIIDEGKQPFDANAFLTYLKSYNKKELNGAVADVGEFLQRWQFEVERDIALLTNDHAKKLIISREKAKKKQQARMRVAPELGGTKRLKQWTPPQKIGRIDYRWFTVWQLLVDLYTPLQPSPQDQ